jgi:hypothetical protein
MTSKWERWATLAGALAVPFWVVGVALMSSKAKGSKGPEILASYHQHSDGILLAGLFWSIGVILFIWFLGSLRSHYLAAEGAQAAWQHWPMAVASPRRSSPCSSRRQTRSAP